MAAWQQVCNGGDGTATEELRSGYYSGEGEKTGPTGVRGLKIDKGSWCMLTWSYILLMAVIAFASK